MDIVNSPLLHLGRAKAAVATALLLAAAILWCVLLLACLQARRGPSRHWLENLARYELRQWFGAVDFYRRDQRRPPFASEGERQDLGRMVQLLDPEFSLAEAGVMGVDPWGEPYALYLDADGDGFIVLGTRTIEANFFMYSRGADQIDDMGQGDDVCLSRQW